MLAIKRRLAFMALDSLYATAGLLIQGCVRQPQNSSSNNSLMPFLLLLPRAGVAVTQNGLADWLRAEGLLGGSVGFQPGSAAWLKAGVPEVDQALLLSM